MEEKVLEKKKIIDIEPPRLYLFVCTGNTCRSPMAEALFNRFYARGDDRAASCGLFAGGSPMSENAVLALAGVGITGFSHMSVQVSEALVRRAFKVIGISANHADRLMFMFPEYAGKICCLPADIPDPYGGDLDEYKKCLKAIKASLDEMFGG